MAIPPLLLPAAQHGREANVQQAHPNAYCCSFRPARITYAKQLLDEMRARGMLPNTASYNCALNGLAKRREWYRARRTFRKMVAQGLFPNVYSYNGMVEAAGMGSLSPRRNMIQVTCTGMYFGCAMERDVFSSVSI